MAEIYQSVSAVLHAMAIKRIGLRTALYGEARVPKKILRKVYLLLVRTQQTRPVLERLLQRVGVLEEKALSNLPRAASDNIALTTFDGAKEIQGGGKLRRLLLQYHGKLKHQLLEDAQDSHHCRDSKDSGPQSIIPRYLRVNLSRCSREAAVGLLQQSFCTDSKHGQAEFASLSIIEDPLLPCVLAVPTNMSHCILSRSDTKDCLVRQGFVSLQDRASCCAALAAEVAPGHTVLDACAAPGSKTLHILDCLGSCGHLVALERDTTRCSVLIKRLLLEAGLEGPFLAPTCIQKSRLPGHSKCTPIGVHIASSPKRESAMTDLKKSDHNFAYLELARIASQQPLFFTRKMGQPTSQHENRKDLKLYGEATGTPLPSIPPSASPASSTYEMDCPALLVEVRCVDFLQVRGHKKPFSSIQTILLDPSCSGSGLPLHGQCWEAKVGDPMKSKEARLKKVDFASCHGPAIKEYSRDVHTSGSSEFSEVKVAERVLRVDGSSISHADCNNNETGTSVYKRSPVVPNFYKGCLPSWESAEKELLPSLSVDSASLDRVKKLQKLQQQLLVHALTHFPRAHSVCYSTCSLYVEENEGVLSSVGLKPEGISTGNSGVESSRGYQLSESNASSNTTTVDTMNASRAFHLRKGSQASPTLARSTLSEINSKGLLDDWFVMRPPLHSGWFPPPDVIEHFVKKIQQVSLERKHRDEQGQNIQERADDTCLGLFPLSNSSEAAKVLAYRKTWKPRHKPATAIRARSK